MIDIASYVLWLKWDFEYPFGIRNNIVQLGITEEQVVREKNQEEMEDLFDQLVKFYDVERFRRRKCTSEGQLVVEYLSEYLESYKNYTETNIATKALIFIWNNADPSLEELRNTIVGLGIGTERVVIRKNREDMENLLYQLSTFGDYTKIMGRTINDEEKKRVQKLMQRVKRKGSLKEVKGNSLS